MIAAGYFYKINGQVLEKHKVDIALADTDISDERQDAVLDTLIDNLEKMEELCKEYNMQMPTEMKLIYEIPTKKFDTHYEYDLMYTNHPTKTPGDIELEWFDEMKALEEK